MNKTTTPSIYYPIEFLHWAGMEDKHIYMVEDIYESNPEHINTLNNFQDNALMIAARLGNKDIVQYLLDKTNIDYRHTNKEGNFLMIAIKYGQSKLVNFLIENYHQKIDFSTKDIHGKTAFHLAAFQGYDSLFESSFIDIEKYIFIQDNLLQTCLYDFIQGYLVHKNYWCFEVIQNLFTIQELRHKNIEGIDILNYPAIWIELKKKELIKNLQKNSPDEHINIHFVQHFINEMKLAYEPLLNILNQKIMN